LQIPFVLTYCTEEILKYLGFVIQLDLMPYPELVVQIHSRIEQLIVVLVLDRCSVQDLVYVGRVTDETTGVQVSFAPRYGRILRRQGFVRPAICLRGE
jgi:hypothetical protein